MTAETAPSDDDIETVDLVPASTAEPVIVSVPPESAQPVSNEPTPTPPALDVDEPQANLAVRVRRSLDLRLNDLVHELRHQGLRSSKAELVELLLWELPANLDADLETRLTRFRQLAGRH